MLLIIELLYTLPKEYKFIGDGQIIIGWANWLTNGSIGSDMVHYWHRSPEMKLRDAKRLGAYKKYGYQTLIIWESEFKDKKKLINKILNFHKKV